MKIIRIEHKETGRGLWTSSDKHGNSIIRNLSCCKEIGDKHNQMPTADEDLGSIKYDEFCAFKSIKSLREWVEPEWMKEMAEAGFKVLLLEVTTCRVGDYQVLYKKENITSMSDITELFISDNLN